MNNDPNLLSAFLALVEKHRPHLCCDIGSMDAGHACFMRARSPSSRIFAFEANPHNYVQGVLEKRVKEYRIEWINTAITDTDKVCEFNVLDVPEGEKWQKGGSSLLKRTIGNFTEHSTLVTGRSLDSFLEDQGLLEASKALWIDAEGALDKVLAGAQVSLKSTLFIHAEIESREHFAGQVLDREIIDRLKAAGFSLVMDGSQDGATQYDGLFVADKLLV